MQRTGLLVLLALAACKDQPADTGGCAEPTWFADADRDGFGNPERGACEEAPTYVPVGGDCNDDNSSVNPDAVESCDGVDNNCDGQIDEGTGGSDTWFRDSDGDGYGDSADMITACGSPPGYAAVGGDCDDNDSNKYPGAEESCDDIDSDCDGDLNDPDAIDATMYYGDADSDGYGDPNYEVLSCSSQPGVVGNGLDCDDFDPLTHPNADERCNGLDDDCDAVVDEDGIDPRSWLPDGDGDGYGAGTSLDACARPDGYTDRGGDCDDGDANISPGAPEVCGDGLDNDCSGDGAGCVLSGNVLLPAADRVYSGEASGDEAGFSIAPGRGDQNGDGVDDLLLSAAGAASGKGRVYVFNGPIGASGSLATANVILEGANSGDQAGIRVAWVGDVNNNGRDEVLVGAWHEDSGGSNAGAAYLARGSLSAGSLSGADVVLLGETRNDYFGTSVAGLGDLNQDGRDDFAVGAWGEDVGGAESGAAFVYLSPTSSGAASTAEIVLAGSAGDQAGWSVAGGEDVDGDGVPDVLVGAVLGDGDASGSGVAFVVSGSSAVTSGLGDWPTLAGEAGGDYFGWMVESFHDLNGDGYGDVAVGAYEARTNGAAYVFFGPVTGDDRGGSADVVLVGAASGDVFGTSVASAGDPSGDGLDELVVGAPEANGAVTGAGAAWLFYSPLAAGTTLTAADAVLQGGARGASAGSSAGGVGDVNDDGLDDLFVAGFEAGSLGGGEIYVLFGASP